MTLAAPMNPAALTALIAEDEPLLATALREALQRQWPELRLVATAGNGQAALALALQHQPTVCFLDIRMPGMSGLEAAQAIAEDWHEALPLPLIVFVTAYDQHALQAYEAHAVDYLVKPVRDERLRHCVERLQRRLRERAMTSATSAGTAGPAYDGDAQTLNQIRALLAPLKAADAGTAHAATAAPPATPTERLDLIQASVGNTIHMVPVAEVIYFEAADKYVRVVTAEREHLIRITLRELLPRLDASRFWQVHRGLVVRADAIATAVRDDSGKVILSLRGRPDKLTASRLYAHLFRGM